MVCFYMHSLLALHLCVDHLCTASLQPALANSSHGSTELNRFSHISFYMNKISFDVCFFFFVLFSSARPFKYPCFYCVIAMQHLS